MRNPIKSMYVVAIFAFALVLTSGLLPKEADAATLQDASLRLKWLASSQFMGSYVAKAKGWYEDEGINLTIHPGGPNIIAENMVASGVDTFGSAGAEGSLVRARSEGLGIIGIGTLLQQGSIRFVSLKGSGIDKFSDIEGKTVSTWFTGPQFVLKGLINKLDLQSVNIVPQPATMVPFINGRVDVATVTMYDEMVYLKDHNVKLDMVYNPAQAGVVIPDQMIIANEKTVKTRPKLVQGFLNATLRGWKYALTHETKAIDILLNDNPNLDRRKQTQELRQIKALMLYGEAKQKGIGLIPNGSVEFTNTFLLKNGVIKKPINVKKSIDRDFWNNVPKAYKVIENPS